jgi:LysM repeat protein
MNKFLKILGLVVAVHVVVLLLMFVNPGCRSTSQRSAPAAADTISPGATAGAPADSTASAVPAVSVNIPSTATVRYSPTRPGTPASAALESAPPADVTPATTYTVVSGDSLWKIARKHGTTQLDLERANRLTSSSKLSVGQKLIIPGKAMAGAPAAVGGFEPAATTTYTIKGGDTLAVVARRVGSTSAELKRLNNLKSDYVQVGQELRLPAGSGPALTEKGSSPAASTVVPVRKADGTVIHVVKPGETIGAIARKYQVKAQDLLVANSIADPRKIRAGQELVIPGATVASVAGPAVSAGSASPTASGPAVSAPEPAPTPPPSSTNQDLDAGLKPQGSVPVIKVDDTGEPKTP